jgi:hypothetical protein
MTAEGRCLMVGSKITQVIPISVKESCCCGMMPPKCPVFKGAAKKLVHILFEKCPDLWTFSNRLSEVIF